jgi:uncharacterized membrane protein
VATGSALAVAAAALPWVRFADRVNLGDLRHYRFIADRMLHGGIPYHEFFVEYPPGSLPIFLLPRLFGDQPGTYGVAFRVLAVAVIVLAVLFVAATATILRLGSMATIVASAFVGVSPALLGSVTLDRYDVWVAALTALAFLLLAAGRSVLASALLGIGAATKVYPVLAVPLVLIREYRRAGARAAAVQGAVFALAFSVVVVPFLTVGFGGVAFSFKTQLTRVLEIESLGGAILLAAHQVGIYHPTIRAGLSFELTGSLPSMLGALETFALFAGLIAVWWWFARGRQTCDDLIVAFAATVAVTLSFDKVLSPQYLVWLVPIVALVRGRTGVLARVLLAVAMVLTAVYFPGHFRDLREGGATAWVVLGRDFVLLALASVLVAGVRAPSSARDAPDVVAMPPVA